MSRQTILLNTHTFSASQFLNHSANSFAVFNGELLFATDDGLYSSTGDNDGYEEVGGEQVAMPIQAWATLPTADFGYNGQKSPRSLILSGDFGGQMQVSLTDESGVTRDYLTIDLGGEPDGTKVALRSDQRSRMMTFKLANVDGSDFSLKSADLVFIPGPERRR